MDSLRSVFSNIDRIGEVEWDKWDAVTLIVAVLPVVLSLYGSLNAWGQVNPVTGEVELSINESHEYYERVLFHEEKHQEVFSNPVLAILYGAVALGGGALGVFSFMALSPRYYLAGSLLFWGSQFLTEFHAIALTSLEFGIWNHRYLALLSLQVLLGASATVGVARMRRKVEGGSG